MSGPTSGISLGVVSKRTPLVDNSAPSGAVASLVATTNGPDSIALTWTAKAGARRYRVERSLNGSTGWALVDYPTTNSFIDTGLALATEYFYRVRAQNAAGAAAYSSTANATTLGQVANLAAVAASSSEIDLTWDADAAASGYQVERSPDGVTWGAPASAGSNSYHSTSLDAETEYFYRARSTSAGDPGPFSATANATTQAAAMGGFALTNLVAGWALTDGPQQTLASTGVVVSGPLDFTVGGEVGAAGFGADGFHITNGFNENGFSASLSQLWAPFQTSTDPILIAVELLTNAATPDGSTVNGPSHLFADGLGEATQLYWFDSGGPNLDLMLVSAGPSYSDVVSSANPLSVATRYVILAWWDGSTQAMQVNGGTPDTTDFAGPVAAASEGAVLHVAPGYVHHGNTLDGSESIRRLRCWKGANAATLAADATFKSWLANSGNGRTDAELAAYTP